MLSDNSVYWFVGARHNHKDQTNRFVKDGIWENDSPKRFIEEVKSIKVGDRIAIKSSYTRKNNLPFDNKNNSVSVMGIKAIGTVIKNYGDGKKIAVDWTPLNPLKEWYFYTNRSTIWRVTPKDWYSEGLIDYTFKNISQDYDRFRNEPYWQERYGDKKAENFLWTNFYEAFATKLLNFKNNRTPLITKLKEFSNDIEAFYLRDDKFKDGTQGFPKDVCPFTVFGIFNRGISFENRITIIQKFAKWLEIEEQLPQSFNGIPSLNNQLSTLYKYEIDREGNEIDKLWDVFEEAIKFIDTDDAEESEDNTNLKLAFDNASRINLIGWQLTTALFWCRPWDFVPLDRQSRTYIETKLGIQIGRNGPKKRCNAADYFKLLNTLQNRFKEDAFPVHSFPELSLAAGKFKPSQNDIEESSGHWRDILLSKIKELCAVKTTDIFYNKEILAKYSDYFQNIFPGNSTISYTVSRILQTLRDDGTIEFLKRGQYRLLIDIDDVETIDEDEELQGGSQVLLEDYSVKNILEDGCFIQELKLDNILKRIKGKKNLILQGPPGTGKTWLAKRLAMALISNKDDSKIKAVQFHPNLTYEDFVRGFRPDSDGSLTLIDGPFMEMIELAKVDSDSIYVLVIEEINRGNPAQILGEMLTLLEVDKRTPNEALELTYRRKQNERVYIPANLYLIGTMNIADRSLALVDFALRRRFAFIDLEPQLNEVWKNWLINECLIEPEIVNIIQKKINALNEEIASDSTLGKQFKIGHSYVTPPLKSKVKDAKEWFIQVVETELTPLLEEYWFDNSEKVKAAKDKLLEGF